MAQLISGLDAAYKRSRNSWQDTSPPPNQMVMHLGPGRTAFSLQFNLDVGNQSYHRDSMNGQTALITNSQPVFALAPPPLLALSPDETGGEVVHRDSMKGQVVDPQNWILGFAILNPFAQPGSVVINPVFNKRPTQETAISRNPILDVSVVTPPFNPPFFEVEQTYSRDSMKGQYARAGAVVIIGVPPAFNEIYTYVPKLKTAQEPYVLPNVVIRGIPATSLPFVQHQGEDHQYRRPKVQEPYVLPNTTAITKPVTTPFVSIQREEHQYRRPKVQEPYGYPNALITGIAPIYIPPFVFQQFEHWQWRGHKTQEHYDFPNVLGFFPPPVQPPIRVMATQVGYFGNETRNIGDVFDIPFSAYADSTHDYLYPAIGWPLFGWMVVVAPTTPLSANAPTPLTVGNKPRTIL